ncbi:unnamed protein product [Brachionus calyciflorus]|uniref:Uncharacterized protein n=1 Tax=Brachionus calyciflorus TaxID=104777 RepID=A0A814EPX4_9BILA|nr:unnamed protein product [Brachionus calyciflorus]
MIFFLIFIVQLVHLCFGRNNDLCDSLVDFHTLSQQLKIKTSQPVNNINQIYSNTPGNGISFNSHTAYISFDIPSNLNAKIASISLSKSNSASAISVLALNNDNFIRLKNNLFSNKVQFNDFSNQSINRIILMFTNQVGSNVQNVKVEIKGCVKESRASKNNPSCNLFKFDQMNTKIKAIAPDAVNDVNKIYPNNGASGVSFNSSRAQVTLENFNVILDSIAIRKDNSTSFFSIILMKDNDFVDAYRDTKLGQVGFTDLPNQPINKIIVLVKNVNGQNVENLKISIRGCSNE